MFPTDRAFPLEMRIALTTGGVHSVRELCNSYHIKSFLPFLTQEGTRMFKGRKKLERLNCSKKETSQDKASGKCEKCS